ncbi:MAG: hypothetical protein HFJ80_02915, partial [Clostridiales bacterium]|nr:hypothetical protein [Clostridiales bacterium]
MKGFNYALPDCIKYLFECLGDFEYLDYWDIAAVTGDTVAQVYDRSPSSCCEYCVSGYLEGQEYISSVFDDFGYTCEYASAEQIEANPTHYIQKIREYIDSGIPVFAVANKNDIPDWETDVGTHCLVIGYECNGQILKLLLWDQIIKDYDAGGIDKLELIFIGEKQREVTQEELYVKSVQKMPHWLTLPAQGGKSFGAAAFRAWAEDIEGGRFEEENLSLWDNYGVYVVNLATSPAIPFFILKRLADRNPAYSDYRVLYEQIRQLF